MCREEWNNTPLRFYTRGNAFWFWPQVVGPWWQVGEVAAAFHPRVAGTWRQDHVAAFSASIHAQGDLVGCGAGGAFRLEVQMPAVVHRLGDQITATLPVGHVREAVLALLFVEVEHREQYSGWTADQGVGVFGPPCRDDNGIGACVLEAMGREWCLVGPARKDRDPLFGVP